MAHDRRYPPRLIYGAKTRSDILAYFPERKRGRQRAPEATLDEIGSRLKQFIAKKYKTPYRCEKETGVPAKSIYDWCKGRLPDSSTLVDLADKLDLNPGWLLTGEGPERLSEVETEMTIQDQLKGALAGDIARNTHERGTDVFKDLPESSRLYGAFVREVMERRRNGSLDDWCGEPEAKARTPRARNR